MKRSLILNVNGEEHQVEIESNRLLLQVLRDTLGLTGTKEGCSIGVCGACSVVIDGRLVSSCLTLAAGCAGKKIETIEGLAKDGKLHPLQQAFIEYGGFQCGICTPGQIMAAKALLDENPKPSEEEVKEWMSGNLCRCTGYYKILESVMAVVNGKTDQVCVMTHDGGKSYEPGAQFQIGAQLINAEGTAVRIGKVALAQAVAELDGFRRFVLNVTPQDVPSGEYTFKVKLTDPVDGSVTEAIQPVRVE